MRKLAFILSGFAMIISVSSCEKNYTCTCVYPNSTIGTSKTDFKAKKKSDADAQCAELHATAAAKGGACAI